MSILVAEDDLVTLQMLESVLANHGYQVVAAQTGDEALQELAESPEVQLVIADIMMPGMDGLELVAQIRQRPEWLSVPIIISTSLADLQTVRQAASVGCRHYLLKPIRAVQLMQKVHEILDHEKQVLRSRRRVMFEASLDYQAYENAANAFTFQLQEMIPRLAEGLQAGRLGGMPHELSRLAEGALLLGAERVADALRRLVAPPAAAPLDELRCAPWVLLREMKALDRALAAQLLGSGSRLAQE